MRLATAKWETSAGLSALGAMALLLFASLGWTGLGSWMAYRAAVDQMELVHLRETDNGATTPDRRLHGPIVHGIRQAAKGTGPVGHEDAETVGRTHAPVLGVYADGIERARTITID